MSIRNSVRRAIIAVVLGAATAALVAAAVLPARAQTAAAGAISISNFTFSPNTLTVKAGMTVTWTNNDDIPHGIAWTDNAFKRSQALDTDGNASFTFTTPGTYRYFCYLHPHMTGTVVVEAATGSSAK